MLTSNNFGESKTQFWVARERARETKPERWSQMKMMINKKLKTKMSASTMEKI